MQTGQPIEYFEQIKKDKRVMDETTERYVKCVKSSFVFITPFNYENEPDMILHPDIYLHGGAEEKAIFDNGGRIICEDMPSVYKFAESVSGIPMQYRVIKHKDGAVYIGLFDSFRAMTRIFGLRVRIGLMSYATAEKLCRIERLDGIVIGPGTKNIVIRAGDL